MDNNDDARDSSSKSVRVTEEATLSNTDEDCLPLITIDRIVLDFDVERNNRAADRLIYIKNVWIRCPPPMLRCLFL